MSYLRYAARIYNTALLITSDKARVLEQVIRAHEEGRASLLAPTVAPAPRRELAVPGVARADAGYLRTANGIAVIQAVGTLVQRSADEQLDAFSGLVAYSTLGAQVQAAADDPRVDAILLEVDSQGGEAPGVIDAAAKIRAAAMKKPLWAIANEQAFSAGYWIASAATQLFAPQTGMVGSIGVRTLHVDQSQRDAKQGLVYTEIASHGRKLDFSPHTPLSDPARAFAQESVDELAAMFVAAVADYRGIEPTAVDAMDAGIFSPQAALALGLIDGIQSFDETLAQLASEASHVRIHGMRPTSARASAPASPATSLSEGDDTMAAPDNTAVATAQQIAEAEVRGQAKVEAEYKAKLDAAQKATADATATAQDRVAKILTHAEAGGRKGLAEYLAFKTSTSIDGAVAMLAAAPKEGVAATPPVNRLDAAMTALGNPQIMPDAAASARTAAGDPSKPPIWSNAQIFAFRKECVAKVRGGRA